MGAGTHWITPVIVVILLGAAVTAYLYKLRLPRDENAAGLIALAGMTWRDFINVVLGALTRRGYTRVFDENATRDDSEYILERSGQRWLLSCKHGSAFVVGSATITEMASLIRLHNLAGGLLLTQGRVADDTRPIAALQRIELLDGPTLWPELRDLIPVVQRHSIEADARQRARKQVVLVWLLALLAIIVLVFTLGSEDSDSVATVAAQGPAQDESTIANPASEKALPAPARNPTAKPPTVQPTTKPTPSTPTAVAARAAVAAPASIAAPADLDAAALERQRSDIASAISTLPMVDRAVWSTQSTLQVYLLDVDRDAKTDICPLLERYPALAASRVQLTPPAGSDATVRFIQCRMY